ncbi:hypothetical protein DFA_01379 [Cavenderia fasciculata]|uniref:Uncharacterized protein n=1 Tax=Cavenderia fasciculata TaxID=261658 RepID=F4PSG3_CACFS|nr:uncharacterized protein DFA_01379 [Cavenderia fasciculata]EGG21493.1 hypothetical protein DFA_01379 [Cavenderia fasciculata]|eukprot:XP_004359343.1 hypothetical protein DFA_01379 [Cavenderia fasciculata]
MSQPPTTPPAEGNTAAAAVATPTIQIDSEEYEKEKTKVKELLNQSLALRNHLKTLTPSELVSSQGRAKIHQLKVWTTEIIELSGRLGLDHGKALGLEFNSFALFCENTSDDIDQYHTILTQLEQARNTVLSLKDKSSHNRILELLTNIYSRTGEIEKEIETIERATRFEKNIPTMIALVKSYLKKLDYIYKDRDRIYSIQTDDGNAYMDLHVTCWDHYQWLKSQPAFAPPMSDSFIKQNKSNLFKLCIYMGSLANPLISQKDQVIFNVSMEAFDEAFFIANLINDKEFICAATAHKSSILYRTLPPDERDQLLESLKKTDAEMKPVNSELRDLIDSIENQAPSLHPEMKDSVPPPSDD